MIYLDHHAATPLVPEAREAMDRALAEGWANPSSVHGPGRRARAVLERARAEVAAAVGASPSDLVFTGGGTEACNLGVLGLGAGGRRVIATRVEHPAVTAAVAGLEARGKEVLWLDAPGGRVPAPEEAPSEVRDALAGDALVVVQWVNHETGAISPIHAWGRACEHAGAALFVDATQALGKVPVDVAALGATACAFAASKCGGPTGAGALSVRRSAALAPQLLGGAQERGRRAGTPDLVALAGFGGAATVASERLAAMPDVARRRDRLEAALLARGAVVNGPTDQRVATVTNASLRAWRGELLVAALDVEGLAAASGAACSSGLNEPSPVLSAMYADDPEAQWRASAALRLSLSPSTTDAEVDEACAILGRVVDRKS